MAIDIVVPALGESITEGTIAAWLKQPGEAVGVDEPLVELETDKATVEICAPKAGVLSEIRVAAGEDVEVGAVIGRIDDVAGTGPQKPTTEASSTEAATAVATPAMTAAAAKPAASIGRLEFPSDLVPAE
ncbi:MAG: dihydrolipoamide succinyltransferase, partial [Myxococcales bacterium]|nr:dihydrolipoamide succinyltransferase [Myxococcales bacterium]